METLTKKLAGLLVSFAVATSAQAADPLKVGVIMPLTGPYGPLGVETMAGVQAATETINKNGGVNGRQIELVVRDDMTSPSQSVIAFKDLAGQRVVGIIGSLSSNSAVATVSLAESAKLPYIGTATAEEQYEPLKKYVFLATAPMASVSEAILQYLSSQKKNKLAVVYDSQNAFSLSGWRHMKRLGDKYQVQFVGSEEITSSATDFSTVLTRLRQTKADAVMFWGIGAAAIAFTKQYKSNGPNVPLVMSTGQASVNRYLAPSGAAAEGVTVATLLADIGSKLPPSPVRTSFDLIAGAYRSKTNEALTGFAANGASAMLILAEGIRRGGTDPSRIQQVLDNLTIATPYGYYHFSPTRHFGLGPDQVVITKVENGGFVPTEWSAATLNKAVGNQ